MTQGFLAQSQANVSPPVTCEQPTADEIISKPCPMQLVPPGEQDVSYFDEVHRKKRKILVTASDISTDDHKITNDEIAEGDLFRDYISWESSEERVRACNQIFMERHSTSFCF